jgi:hypothetical protein
MIIKESQPVVAVEAALYAGDGVNLKEIIERFLKLGKPLITCSY